MHKVQCLTHTRLIKQIVVVTKALLLLHGNSVQSVGIDTLEEETLVLEGPVRLACLADLVLH